MISKSAFRRSILFLIAFSASFVACNHLSFLLSLSCVTFSSLFATPFPFLFPLSFSFHDKRFPFISVQAAANTSDVFVYFPVDAYFHIEVLTTEVQAAQRRR